MLNILIASVGCIKQLSIFFLVYENNLNSSNSRGQFFAVEYLHVEHHLRLPTLSCFVCYSKHVQVSWELLLSTSHGPRYLRFLMVLGSYVFDERIEFSDCRHNLKILK